MAYIAMLAFFSFLRVWQRLQLQWLTGHCSHIF